MRFKTNYRGNPAVIMGLAPGPGPSPEFQFKKGNRMAATENVTPEAHSRRMAGVIKAWRNLARVRKGEKVMTLKLKKKSLKRKRLRLKATIAKEMREIQDRARKHAESAMERVEEIVANSDNETTVLQAAQIIFDRAYGKASQTNINAQVSGDGKANEITAAQLDARIAKALQRVEELSRGKKQTPSRPQRSVDLRKLDRDPNSTPLN